MQLYTTVSPVLRLEDGKSVTYAPLHMTHCDYKTQDTYIIITSTHTSVLLPSYSAAEGEVAG